MPQQEPLENNVDVYNKGSISSDTYEITEKTSQNTPIITTYQNATIKNMFYNPLTGNSNVHFVKGLGLLTSPERSNRKNID